jgi:hypothetical protein
MVYVFFHGLGKIIPILVVIFVVIIMLANLIVPIFAIAIT